MALTSESEVWYVAYGSNMSAQRLTKHLGPHDQLNAPLEVPVQRRVYFAGASKRWGGPVAFMSLVEDSAASTITRAYKVTLTQLEMIGRSENGMSSGAMDLPIPLHPGEWTVLPIGLSDKYKGKYNALLRLPDIEGRPALTFTTARELPLGVPSDEYLRAVLLGTKQEEWNSWANRAGPAVSVSNIGFLGSEIRFVGTPEIGKSRGFSLIHLPAVPDLGEHETYVGTLESAAGSSPVWVEFSHEVRPGAMVLAPRLKHHVGHLATVTVDRPRTRHVIPGLVGDLPDSDVVMTSDAEAARLGRWGLLATSRFSAPVRVQGRADAPDEVVRIAYAARTLTSVGKGSSVNLQPLKLPRRRLRDFIVKPFRWLAEKILGAPPIALRATEGLVGDEGRRIVRVDETALDFVGCSAGDVVVVTWATRRCLARVLLHTEVTRERMHLQLSEATGYQARQSTGDVESRIATPTHLQAWMSPSVRAVLDVPPDTVVRIRRSIPHTLAKNASALALPIAGLVLAALAIPGALQVAAWALVPVVVLTLLPLRIRPR